MKISLKTLYASFDALKALSQLPLKAALSYDLSCLLNHVEKEVQIFENVRFNLIKRLGSLTDDNSTYKVNPENMASYEEEINELLSKELEIENVTLFLDDLGDNKLEPVHMMSLKWLIKK